MDKLAQKLLVFVLMLGVVATAGASPITLDGNFAAQTNGSAVGSPWDGKTGGFATGSTNAQSPFTNLYPKNAMGVTLSNYAHDYMGIGCVPVTTGLLGFNVDFTVSSFDSGTVNFTITKDWRADLEAAYISVSAAGVYAKSSAGNGASLLTPELGKWYNVQLTLNLDTNRYYGTITPDGGSSVAIDSRDFVASGQGINSIVTDNANTNSPSYSVDNFALTIPEPAALSLLVLGGVLLARRRDGTASVR